jgi:hypothetical protein
MSPARAVRETARMGSEEKAIKLRGGPADGRRIVVRIDTTEATIPVPEVEGFAIYGPSADRTTDGLEVWDLLEDSGFSDTGLAPL